MMMMMMMMKTTTMIVKEIQAVAYCTKHAALI